MVGASKILTVSYGTFSCTLEGFDEPFSTMKSIAEYFRDLAADDRYFGAEPPTPDAEMLHRIAEREVQRRVEARVGDDGIVLRQMEHAETAEPSAVPTPAPTLAPTKVPVAATLADLAAAPQPDETQADSYASAGAETAAPAAYEAPEYTAPEADFSAAGFEPSEELQETEEVAAAEDAATEEPLLEAGAETETPAPQTYEETYEEISETYEQTYEEVAGAYPAEEPAEDAAEAAYQTGPAAEAYEDEEQDVADTPLAADAAAEPAPVEDDNSVAAKLSRIRAVVGAADAADITDEADTADEADQPVAQAANIDASFAEAFEDLDAQDDETELSGEPEVEDAELTEFCETFEADLAALDGEMPHETYASEDDETAEDMAAEHSPADESEDEADALDLSAYIAQPGEVAQDDVEPEIVEVQSAAAEPSADEDHGAEISAEDEAAQDVLEDDVDSSLSDQDEAELVALLRKAEAARQDSDSYSTEEELDQDEELLQETAEADEYEAEQSAADTSKSGDSSFDRILEETNSKLDDTEGTRRRSAIAHLKAAVAATKADRLLGRNRKDDEEAEEQSQYRDDLAKVVRPRREFEKTETSSARPVPLEEKPSPLVLVSEQRVDHAETEDAAPQPSTASVLPRRVSMAARDAEDEDAGDNGMGSYADVDTSFAEFAEEMGAVELPDLLEAAAAYSAFVEGNKHFSRPQLMRKVATYEKTEEYSREAGLRSFGQLLRQGKIQKLRRGQFTIREDTRFNPEARLAGE